MANEEPLSLSFSAKFPEPVKIGTMVTLVGEVNNDTEFDIYLVCKPSGDSALHCAFRPDKKTEDGKVVRSSSGSGDEEKEGIWPIEKTGEFEIAFWIKGEHIEIYVGGKLFTTFQHRLPYSKITDITGNAKAHYTSIKFQKTTKSPAKHQPS